MGLRALFLWHPTLLLGPDLSLVDEHAGAGFIAEEYLGIRGFQFVFGELQLGRQLQHRDVGRRASNKTAIGAGLHRSDEGRPLYMRLTPVQDFTNEHMRQRAATWSAMARVPLPRCARPRPRMSAT